MRELQPRLKDLTAAEAEVRRLIANPGADALEREQDVFQEIAKKDDELVGHLEQLHSLYQGLRHRITEFSSPSGTPIPVRPRFLDVTDGSWTGEQPHEETAVEVAPGGILTNTENDQILPLYGRPTHPGSGKWLYHTATDKFQSIKVPVQHASRDCSAEHGCNELYDADNVRVPAYGDREFRTTIYSLDAPRYIPYL